MTTPGGAGPRRVLVTHADQPLGRRIVGRLFRDERVAKILAVGDGPTPRSFDHLLAAHGRRFDYARADLARHRSVADLFHSERVRESQIDAVVHVPSHGPVESPSRPIVAGIATRTAEARLVLQQCIQSPTIHDLVALGSAFVYRLLPGNANRLTEDSELNLDPDAPSELRSWVDCDMIFHGEVHNEHLRVVLLRLPAVVGAGGAVFFHPSLSPIDQGVRTLPELRPLGYDPLCPLISEEDVTLAVARALHVRHAGVYNVSGSEALPLSELARWTGRSTLPLPGLLLSAASRLGSVVSGGWRRMPLDGPQLRYGFTLDTARAASELDFRPRQRIGLARGGDGRIRIEAAPI